MIQRLIATASVFASLIHVASTVSASEPASAIAPSEAEFFESKIRPLLAKRCFECHGPDSQEGGLRLDRKAAAFKGGESGPAIVPGDVDDGFLVDAIRYGDYYQMPPTGKLPEAEIALLTEWVRKGAPWPADLAAPSDADEGSFDLKKRRNEHWSWRTLSDAPLPKIVDEGWARDPLDRFIRAKLEENGLSPAAPADRRDWLRRATFDLIGLPPTADETEAFVTDRSPDAFERVVDRLLASPRFGERWARHWLDLMRYAESRGHEFDYTIPNASEYRDYVVRAFNADVPYDQFVIEHLAGDLVWPPRRHVSRGFNESVLGTGFWNLGEEVHSPVDIRADETDRIENKLDVASKAFLGLTVACARCHDHKFDAISTKDYYSLSGFVLSSRYRQVRFETEEHNREVARRLAESSRRHRDRLSLEIAEAAAPTLDRLPEYLLAARRAAADLKDPNAFEERPLSDDVTQAIASAADARNLSEAVLRRWLEHLLDEAANDAAQPLHPWAKTLFEETPTFELGAAADAADSARPIVDFARIEEGRWIADGVAFGDKPAEPGDLLWNGGSGSGFRIAAMPAAEYDPAWDVLNVADGTQPESGKLSGWVRAGRTLHTETFIVPETKLYYLARGSAHVYASVDSHHMINGPLHGALLRQIDGGDGFQWFAHDLTAYAGHRVHIEFTPKQRDDGPADFALAMVVASDSPPPQPSATIRMAFAAGDVATPEAFASAIAGQIRRAVERFSQGRLESSVHPDADAQWIDWIVQRPRLWTSASQWHSLSDAAAERQRLLAEIEPTSRLAPALLDGNGVDEKVLVRGNHRVLGEPAPRQFLQAMPEMALETVPAGSGRLELARRIVDPENPYVSRVLVNRVWHHLFGRGIVETVDNFGVLGHEPTHPELLDHLARRFIDDGWSLKRLLRSITLSQTYRMSSAAIEAQRAADPQNLWLHSAPIRRLQAEAIRDGILALSGRLDTQMYGVSIPVHLTPFMDGRGRPAESGPLDGAGRRSLYLAVRRNFLSPMMLVFDAPIPFSAVGRRTVSNVPAQALALMNDPFVLQMSQLWAQRIVAEPGGDEAKIRRMFLDAYSRPPEKHEVADCLDFLAAQAADYGLTHEETASDPRPWADLCHMLFNSKEFLFLR